MSCPPPCLAPLLPPDMSDEVSQFLEQVERLRGQQIEEDEVRARELEEYLAAKRERQARREERARSISPQKSSPANTPSPRSNRRSIHLTEALKLESPIPASAIARDQSLEPELKHDTAAAMDTASSPTKENQPPLEHESKTAGPPTASSRASPLAWQRRPNSRGSGRPLSMVAAQNATQRSLTGSQEPHSATEQTFSRDQIAQSLGSKDPAWFRQTADRGIGSAAYRKNQVEDNDRLDMSSVKAQLPGMSASNDNHLSQPDRAPAQLRLASPEPLVPAVEATESRPTSDATDAPTGRTSPIRTTSPTKGMGGFVQSAMMKRSDSVKRWSVVSPPGLTRADTVTSGRAPLERNVTGGASLSTSRPVSRQGEKDQEPEIAAQEEPVRQSAEPSPRKVSNEDAELPISPSKTMDSRRWSPTKTSWLESALNKPESPKPGSKPAMPSQPSWRVDLKNKTERSNTPDSEASRGAAFSHRHQVSIGGLMRSSPMGAAARNTTGLGGIYSPPPGGNRPKAQSQKPKPLGAFY
ncbi:hypothetical protein B0I35DRAFT_44148 [Stachybotrys elegans]|uniref:DUF4045 domain-containing protein n=1 Tax=Stachybotrys elegans TaxID=80388 RepID=A0A8K0T3X0_9HYPO|nr:hypothetical protein B0I35DRAFT_44148 [Stachybotrys elegans]